MTFTRTAPYPKWNPASINNIPGIPNWEPVVIGDYTINFEVGNKICEATKRNSGNYIYSGDYTIHITSDNLNWNNHRYTDAHLFTNLLIPNIQQLNLEYRSHFIDALRYILSLEVENDVLTYIINEIPLVTELKVSLYTLWHRAIIEDRLYHQSMFAGHKQVIGITIALIKKLNNEIFVASDEISAVPYIMPDMTYYRNCRAWYNL